MRTSLDHLFEIGPPFLTIGPGEVDRHRWNVGHFYARPDRTDCVRRVRGNKMRTTQALMNEFAAAFQFFAGFGENWNALEECLDYLDEWLPADGYIVVVENAEDVLGEEPQYLSALLCTLDRAGRWWSEPVEGNGRFDRPARPFHVLLHFGSSPSAMSSRQAMVTSDAAGGVPVRVLD